MYKTRSQMKVGLPASVFGWLGVASFIAWATTISMCVLAASTLAASTAVDGPILDAVRGWSWLLTPVLFSFVLVPAIPAAFYIGTIIQRGRDLRISLLREVVRSCWSRVTTLWWTLLLAGIVVAKLFGSEPGAEVALLVFSAGAFTAGYISTRELGRLHRRSTSTPLITEGVAPASRYESAPTPLWQALGPDWTAPECIVQRSTAHTYRELAAARATTMQIVGRTISWLFGALTITALYWAFNAHLPYTVAVPVVLGAVTLLGWSLERRAAKLDRLADMYATRAEKIHPWLTLPQPGVSDFRWIRF